MSQHLILKKQQRLDVSEILREYGKKFKQVRECYTDGKNGRCALGVLMSYFGWDGTDYLDAASGLQAATDELKRAGINEDLLIELNDSGMTFGEIADYLDRSM
jgi:hypothetical protein